MVKRGRVERAASAAARTGGSGIGASIGTALSSPFGIGVLIVGGLLAAGVLFRKDIGAALGGIGSGITQGLGDISVNLPDIKFPDIKFPDFKFPDFSFPDFKFPDLPTGADLGLPNTDPLPVLAPDDPVQTEGPLKGFEGSPEGPKLPDDKNLFQTVILDPLLDFLTPAQKFAAAKEGGGSGTLQLIDFLGLDFAPQAAAELTPEETPQETEKIVSNLIGTEQVFQGGGVGFSFGAINPTPITSLTQVLNLFPEATASQAADFLSENKGILPEAALLKGFDVINISESPDDPPQMFNQTSIEGLSGDPEEIFKFLFPNVISNF